MIIKYSKSLQEARERNEAMQENKEKGNNGFFVPGDLPVDNRKDIDVKNCTMDDIQNYLVSVVSEREYESICELGVLVGAGEMIVSFDKLKQMVDEGYNIVRAKAFNKDMIMVKFQKYSDDKELVECRRRF